MSSLRPSRRGRGRGRALLPLAVLLAALLLQLGAPAAEAACTPAHPKPRTSLTAVWFTYVCPSCHEPLPVAQSPQAEYERQYVQHLVALCDTPAEIKTEMIAQYTTSVLAKPPAKGFNWVLYVLPPVLLVLGVAFLLVTLPKWRARAKARAAVPFSDPGEAAISAEDAARLDEDLAGFS